MAPGHQGTVPVSALFRNPIWHLISVFLVFSKYQERERASYWTPRVLKCDLSQQWLWKPVSTMTGLKSVTESAPYTVTPPQCHVLCVEGGPGTEKAISRKPLLVAVFGFCQLGTPSLEPPTVEPLFLGPSRVSCHLLPRRLMSLTYSAQACCPLRER